ncbi:radial spoke protein 11 [Plasmopara halstedii]|uniref:Radial spoke protein 11 n=1 Tax=Plasmopara halstedii TaxID=4781 RepID=A0A0P1AD84_PLAHL|nr:radial spoke protein 11 [Plasmopara halstedii]CEG38426.1 radial spoke protein 11 [Plasmopara halstedii]|eukprot:XP_024574795.1 radial spoke protein 11 [Plasmopara halstedii]
MEVNRIFTAEQIAVPPDLPHVLKDWTKAVIRANPSDLLTFSQLWFQEKMTQLSEREAIESQLQRMRQLFKTYDVEGQGRMEVKNLGKFLSKDLGIDGYEDGSPAELLDDLVMELDPDNTGLVELQDIIQWYKQR